MIDPPLLPGAPAPPAPDAPDAGSASPDRIREVARAFEAAFLAEMLSHAGLGRTPEAFGGGAGETAFASLLVREQARLLSDSGGVGLSEAIVRSLIARSGR